MIHIPNSKALDLTLLDGGLYFWVRYKTNEVLYVGKSGCFMSRISFHHVIKKDLIQPGDEIRVMHIADPRERDRLELVFIKAYEPRYNRETRHLVKQPKPVRKPYCPVVPDLSPHEYAHSMGVTAQTVRNWIKSGRIKATQPAGKNGRWCIPRG